MRREPASDLGGLMGGVVVEDQVKVEIGRRLLVDLLQKAQEFPAAMAGMQLPMTTPVSTSSAANSVVVP
jgi:hypothetical protein